MALIIPADTHTVGDTGHVGDHNNISDVLTLLAAKNIAVAPYSADRTGTADSTAAVNNAIADASAAGGGTVYVPPGTYKWNTGMISAASSVHVIGAGYGAVQVNASGSASGLFNLDPPGYSTSVHVEDFWLTGMTLNVTGMDIFWGANIIRCKIFDNYLVQNSTGKSVMNVRDTTGTNGVTYLSENYFRNKELANGARTTESWHLDFSGTGMRANDNVWDAGGSKIWTGTGTHWLRLIGDATILGSKHNTWRDLIFENSGGSGGHIWLQNTSDFLIDNISSEDLSSGTLSNPMILLNAYTTGPGCQGGVIRHYSRRSGSNISNSVPDIKLDANCSQITIDSPSQSSGGTALTVDFGSAANCVRSGAWPSGAVILNRGTGNTYV